MEIVYRNFIRLLSIGSFNQEESVEPMSVFKWKQLLMLADTYEVTENISYGIIKTDKKTDYLVPKGIIEIANQNLSGKSTDFSYKKTGYNYAHKYEKRFANVFLNHRLKKLIYNEVHSIDTSIASLVFLDKTIENINAIISSGINFKDIIDIGLYLRKNGDKIDFIKYEQWINSLGIKNASNAIGSYLITLFCFELDELPYMKNYRKQTFNMACKPLKYTLTQAAKDNHKESYEQRIAKKLHLPNSKILSHFSFFPLEVSSKFIAGIYKSLSNIEE